jgi:hypothetical protein
MLNTFQHNLPLFVKAPFTATGRQWKPGKHFPWLEMGMDLQKVQILFNQGFVHHNQEREKELKSVGDGLNELGIEELHTLVDSINKKVKEKTPNESEFKKKKCASSKIPDKQRGHIRRWRNLYGHMETD